MSPQEKNDLKLAIVSCRSCFKLIDEKVGGEIGRHYTREEAEQLAQEFFEWWGYKPNIVQENACSG